MVRQRKSSENYNEKGSVFRIAKKGDKYFLVVKSKEEEREMCGVRVHHKSPMKAIRTGMLPNGVWHRGNIAVTMNPGYD